MLRGDLAWDGIEADTERCEVALHLLAITGVELETRDQSELLAILPERLAADRLRKRQSSTVRLDHVVPLAVELVGGKANRGQLGV